MPVHCTTVGRQRHGPGANVKYCLQFARQTFDKLSNVDIVHCSSGQCPTLKVILLSSGTEYLDIFLAEKYSVDLTLSLVYSERWRAATLLPRPRRGKNTLFTTTRINDRMSFTLCRLHTRGLRCQYANLGSRYSKMSPTSRRLLLISHPHRSVNIIGPGCHRQRRVTELHCGAWRAVLYSPAATLCR